MNRRVPCIIAAIVLVILVSGVANAQDSATLTPLGGWSTVPPSGSGEFIWTMTLGADGRVLLANAHSITTFSDDGRYLGRLGGGLKPRGLAEGPEGTLYISDELRNQVVRLSPEGRFIDAWGTTGNQAGEFGKPNNIAVDSQGFVWVTDFFGGRLQKFTGDGEYLLTADVSVDPSGATVSRTNVVATDSEGYVYVVPGSRIVKLDSMGRAVTEFRLSDTGVKRLYLWSVAVAPNGVVYAVVDSWLCAFRPDGSFAERYEVDGQDMLVAVGPTGTIFTAAPYGHRVSRYAAPVLPPPPPPVEPIPPLLLLHIAPTGAPTSCASPVADIADIVTAAPAALDGSASYVVYLLASPGNELDHLAGVQLGVLFDQSLVPGQKLYMHGWHLCADLDFADDAWPSTGSGNTITWVRTTNCQRGPVAVAGYFEVTAYEASIMTIAGWPHTGLVKVADCNAAETVLDTEVGTSQVGWVTFGGGGYAGSTSGCNPALGPCEHDLEILAPRELTPLPQPWRVTPVQPNPTSTGSSIGLGLASPWAGGRVTYDVRVEVFDLAGRSVSLLCNEALPPGSHQWTWDGVTPSGLAASGIYMVRVVVDGRPAVVQRIVRIR